MVGKPEPPSPQPLASRLGAELLRPRGEPLSVVVARTSIDEGKVQVEMPKVGPVHARRGDRILVKHAYHIVEGTDRREECRVLLDSDLDGQRAKPALKRVQDQAWFRDLSGCLQHEFLLDEPGRHELRFRAGAEYALLGNGDGSIRAIDQKASEGLLLVEVA